MSSTPPAARSRRDWTLPIVAGVLALVVVLVVCVVGGITAFVTLRGESKPSASPSVAAPRPSVSPPPTAKPAQDCLLGDWEETSYVATVEIFGVRVQLTGKGRLMRIEPGTTTSVYDNYVVAGSANGSRYEVVHNGTIVLNYQADATSLHFSNPKVQGTTTWKVNGRVRDSEPMQVLLTPDKYICSGNELRIYGEGDGDGYASELRRILPPGVPV